MRYAFQRKAFTPHFAPLEVENSQPAMGVCLKSTTSENITVRSSSVISNQQTNQFNILNKMRQGSSLDKICSLVIGRIL
jgi:hypothetical protein